MCCESLVNAPYPNQTHVARLLHNSDRLIHTCFRRDRHSQHAHQFLHFSSSVYEGRWGEVLAAAEELLPLHLNLRAAWDVNLYSYGGPVRPERDDNDGDEYGVKLGIADAAIRSDAFWAYVDMICEVGACLLHCMHWCESCPCHEVEEHAALNRNRHSRLRRFRLKYHTDALGCPMRSRRAPEMANGDIIKIARALFNMQLASLVLLPSVAALNGEEKAAILRDFRLARQHILMTFTIKFSHWRQLPWVCIGVAHPSRDVAASCMERAIALIPSASQEARRHPYVRLLCDPASPVFAEVVGYIRDGIDLHDLPVLERIVGRFAFIPIAERWVESLHAKAKKDLMGAPHFSSVHLAFKSMQRQLRDVLVDHPELLIEMSEHCTTVKNPRASLEAMGLWMHPDVQEKLGDELGSVRGFGRHLRPWVIELIYHCDPDTVFKVSGAAILKATFSNLR